MPSVGERLVVKEIISKGNILNDNDVGVDYLGHSVYAEALAQRIQSVNTPITIGLFARWGSGKSFLVKHVKDYLRRYQHQYHVTKPEKQNNYCKHGPTRCCVHTFVLTFMVFLVVTCSIFAASPVLLTQYVQQSKLNTTINGTIPSTATISQDFDFTKFVRYFALSILLLCLVLVSVIVCCNQNWWSAEFFGNFRLISYAAFTKLPSTKDPTSIIRDTTEGEVEHILREEESVDNMEYKDQRYIFVDFNAWEYAGSDTLWAGIVTNVSDAIEAEFGSVTSRLFRMLTVETIPPDVTSCRLFIKLNETDQTLKEEIKGIMLQYGVVLDLKLYNSEQQEVTCDGWWIVDYSYSGDAANAKQYLELQDIEATFDDPGARKPREGSSNSLKVRTANSNTNKNNHDEVIEMNDINTGNGSPERNPLIEQQPETENKSRVENTGFWKHFRQHPKTTCNFPNLYWWILLTTSFISIPVITIVIADAMKLDVFRTPRAVPVVVQVVSWLPAVAGAAVVMIRLTWAMFHSQRNRVNTALAGAKGNMAAELGFMNKVKTEVHVITKLIECVRFTHKKKFKVVITIDDLDRVPLSQVKSVLEAVSILLSDRSSPFICLIALDSRVAVKCIEEDMGSALLKANVNGHEYLKKIINLPFCLPEIDNTTKQHYIGGLIDQGNKKKEYRRVPVVRDEARPRENARPSQPPPSLHASNGYATRPFNNISTDVMKETDIISDDDDVDETDGYRVPSNEMRYYVQRSQIRGRAVVRNTHSTPNDTTPISNGEFIAQCKIFLYESEMVRSHLLGNPRNIKRIFNVLSLTTLIIGCSEKERKRAKLIKYLAQSTRPSSTLQVNGYEAPPSTSTGISATSEAGETENVRNKSFAQDMVFWIVLTDQWPYRVSYLLQVIEDADQRSNAGRRSEAIEDNMPLLDIYEKHVIPELHASMETIDGSLLSLDADPDILYSFLYRLKLNGNHLNKGRVSLLNKYTVNLDHSLKQSIAYQRDVADMERFEKARKAKEATAAATTHNSSMTNPAPTERVFVNADVQPTLQHNPIPAGEVLNNYNSNTNDTTSNNTTAN
ncbi:uncharacterized protein LOC100180590 [Ciona intestinalis]